jgi:hypothetical protein
MNRKQLALSAALIVLLASNAYAVYLYGYIGFFRTVLANFAGVATFVDLIIALVLILAWIGDDARRRNVSAIPYLVLTIALGSVGPLVYLIRRASDPTAPAESLAPSAART